MTILGQDVGVPYFPPRTMVFEASESQFLAGIPRAPDLSMRF